MNSFCGPGILQAFQDGDLKYCLLVGQAITVGRRDTDIVIASDPTVSRKHATLQVTHPEANLANPRKLPLLVLKDESRFGTWVNNVQLSAKSQRPLSDGDEVRFGSPKSTFLCVYEPLVLTTSCLDTGQKRAVRGIMTRLGGHVTKEWQKDCSALVMASLSVTVKVVCAMVSLKPIVTVDYLTDLQGALSDNKPPPDPQQYCPELSDPNLNPNDVCFKPNPARKTLFHGKTFVFLNKTQFNKLSLTVEMAGGTPILQESDDNNNNILTEDDTVVMTSDPEDATLPSGGRQWIQKVLTLLKRSKKRMIPDSDIGYAVVYCSTEKYCNPSVSQEESVTVALPSQSLSERPFTQDSENIENSKTKAKRGKVVTGDHKLSQPTGQRTERPDENVDVKADVRLPALSIRESEDFSVKHTSAVSTPRLSGRKRLREDEIDKEYSIGQKSARTEEPVKIKTEKLSQPDNDQDESICKSGRTPKRKEKQDGSSSDEMGPPASSRRSRVFVPDTEVDNSLYIREKRLSDTEGPSRISDSDPEIKPTPTPRTRRRPTSESDDLSSVSPKKRPAKSDERKTTVKSEPVSVIEDAASAVVSDEEMTGRTSRNVAVTDKKMKVSPAKQIESGDSKYAAETGVTRRVRNDGPDGQTDERTERMSDHVQTHTIKQQDVPEGFLTTRLPIENQHSKRSEYEPGEVNVQIDIQFKSLVVRQPQRKTSKAAVTDESGYTIWKGRRLKNFKKFKKSVHVGSGMLPRIIGGRDLEPHVNNPRKELDEWYRDALQEESQRNEEDRMASQLFDWDRRPAKGKGRRSR